MSAPPENSVQALPGHQSFIRVGVSHVGLARPKAGSRFGGLLALRLTVRSYCSESPTGAFTLSDLASASISDTMGGNTDNQRLPPLPGKGV